MIVKNHGSFPIYLLCEPCLEEQLNDLDTEFEIEILPE